VKVSNSVVYPGIVRAREAVGEPPLSEKLSVLPTIAGKSAALSDRVSPDTSNSQAFELKVPGRLKRYELSVRA